MKKQQESNPSFYPDLITPKNRGTANFNNQNNSSAKNEYSKELYISANKPEAIQSLNDSKPGASAMVLKESVDQIKTEKGCGKAIQSSKQLLPDKTKTFDSVSDFSSSSNSIDYKIGQVQQELQKGPNDPPSTTQQNENELFVEGAISSKCKIFQNIEYSSLKDPKAQLKNGQSKVQLRDISINTSSIKEGQFTFKNSNINHDSSQEKSNVFHLIQQTSSINLQAQKTSRQIQKVGNAENPSQEASIDNLIGNRNLSTTVNRDTQMGASEQQLDASVVGTQVIPNSQDVQQQNQSYSKSVCEISQRFSDVSLIASQEKSYTETSRFEDQNQTLQQQEPRQKAILLDEIKYFIEEAQKCFYILLMLASLALIALKTDKDAMMLQMFNGCFQILFLVLQQLMLNINPKRFGFALTIVGYLQFTSICYALYPEDIRDTDLVTSYLNTARIIMYVVYSFVSSVRFQGYVINIAIVILVEVLQILETGSHQHQVIFLAVLIVILIMCKLFTHRLLSIISNFEAPASQPELGAVSKEKFKQFQSKQEVEVQKQIQSQEILKVYIDKTSHQDLKQETQIDLTQSRQLSQVSPQPMSMKRTLTSHDNIKLDKGDENNDSSESNSQAYKSEYNEEPKSLVNSEMFPKSFQYMQISQNNNMASSNSMALQNYTQSSFLQKQLQNRKTLNEIAFENCLQSAILFKLMNFSSTAKKRLSSQSVNLGFAHTYNSTFGDKERFNPKSFKIAKQKPFEKGKSLNLNVQSITPEFFKGLPNWSEQKQVSSMQIFDQLVLMQNNDYFDEQNSSGGVKLLRQCYLNMLHGKIYSPYFVSNSTFVMFSKLDKNEKLSLMDIIERFHKLTQYHIKLYFMVRNSDLNVETDSTQTQEKTTTTSPLSAHQFNKNSTESLKLQRYNQIQYYEIEIKAIESTDNNIQSSVRSRQSNQSRFSYQQSIKSRLQMHENNMLLFSIKNISQLVKQLQKISNQKYMDAIEMNYSHEQMNPLNCILGNSKIIYKRLVEMNREFEKLVDSCKPKGGNYQNIIDKNDETIRILNSITQAGQIMWFFNQNQIQRMKISKDDFKIKETQILSIKQQIDCVISPFTPQLLRRDIKVYVNDEQIQKYKLCADWKKYQLIFFNIFQNSVKYNKYSGKIIINFKLVAIPKLLDEERKANYTLITEVIDTGIGIGKDKQKMLFKPFQELRLKDKIQEVENTSIGMGLTLSKDICKQLNGDVILYQSSDQMTMFIIQMPIQAEEKMNIEDLSAEQEDKQYEIRDIQLFKKELELYSYLKADGCKSIKELQLSMSRVSNSIKMVVAKDFKHPKSKRSSGGLGAFNSVAKLTNMAKIINKDQIQQGIPSEKQAQPQEELIMPRRGQSQNIQQLFFNQHESSSKDNLSYNPYMGSLANLLQNNERNQAVKNAAVKSKLFSGKQNSPVQAQQKKIEEITEQNEQKLAKQTNQLINKLNHKTNQEIQTQFEKRQIALQMIAYNQDEAIIDKILMMSSNKSSAINMKISNSENGNDYQENSFVKDIDLRGGKVALELSNDDSYQIQNSDEESESAQERSNEQSAKIDKSSSMDAEENNDKFNFNFNAQSQKQFVDTPHPQVSEGDASSVGNSLSFPKKSLEFSKSFDKQLIVEKNLQQERSTCKCLPRVMCVDDSEFNIIPVKHMIEENFDIKVDTAFNGLEAVLQYENDYMLECQCENRCHRLILMDLQMPIMDGIIASKKILEIVNNGQCQKRDFQNEIIRFEEEKMSSQEQEKDWQFNNQQRLSSIIKLDERYRRVGSSDSYQGPKEKANQDQTNQLLSQKKLMKTILQNGSPVQTSIVVVTAFSNQSSAEECEKIGIKAVIHKPLTFDKLQYVLQKYFYGFDGPMQFQGELS